MTLVYLAKPIDFVSSVPLAHVSFESKLDDVLQNAGCTVYDPSAAWDVNGPMSEDLARAIEGTNRQALRRADVVVAWLPEGVQTQGVPAEIEFASRHQGIQVIVLGHVGVSLTANPLVSVLREEDVEKLPRQIELALMSRTFSDYRIRYSAPEGVTLATVHDTDAGLDLPAADYCEIPPHDVFNVPTGVHIELPVGSFGWIVARSSTYSRFGVQVLPGVIDQGYQGELLVNCLNLGQRRVEISKGDRIGQLLIMHNSLAGFQLTKVDPNEVHPHRTRRGTSGFGSSGR